jgi:hypothetical protein
MKWNILVGTIVLGFGLCTQSYGFELLDRMLGIGGCGCETKCCDAKAARGCSAKAAGCAAKSPTCCAQKAAPACGCEAKAPTCVQKAAPTCGCEAKAAPTCGCEAKAPTCGADPACGCDGGKHGCKRRCRPCLLERIFSCHRGCNNGCGSKCGGCGAEPACGVTVMESNEMPPMPPAPVVDPSAYVPVQRRVVHASMVR